MSSSSGGRSAIITQAYQALYPDPIAFAKGDLLTVGERDSEWPSFIWCVGPDGRAGWTLDHVFELIGPGQGRAIADYDARELSVAVGEPVIVEQSAGGWHWVANARGERGWVPEACFEDGGR
jgi:hypothetical protein